MRKKLKKIMAIWCSAAILIMIPWVCVRADEKEQHDTFEVTENLAIDAIEVEVGEDIIEDVDSSESVATDSSEALVADEELIVENVADPADKSEGLVEFEDEAITEESRIAAIDLDSNELKNPRIQTISRDDGQTDLYTIWDCIWFGEYPQNTPIKWRVLSINGNDAFLLSDESLLRNVYNTWDGDITWETCSLRQWLNNDFYNSAFSDNQKGAIQNVELENADNPLYGTNGGNNTKDFIYLLSISEATNKEYGFFGSRFGENNTRKAEVAISQHDNGIWWLRSPGYRTDTAAYVLENGAINLEANAVLYNSFAVRPAMHIDLSSRAWSYAGTTCSDPEKWYGSIYTSGDNLGNLTNEIQLTCPFEECVFKTKSTEYNPELAYYLAALCRSAYGLAKDNKTFEEQTINIKKSLRSLGFDIDSYFVCDYKDDYSPAYTIAKKPLSDESSLVLITIRGSYNLDWANNAAFGPISMLGFGKHHGFEEGAEQIYNMLKRFLGEISSNNVYVITGHSQGGGVGNLLAVKLYDNQVPISNVYNYNFSAPNVACLINPQDWNANGIHDNIFNIALDNDPVSFLPCNSIPVFDVNPLATWGKFGRSFWYVPSQEDAYLVGHDLKEVVYLLSHQYPLSKFSDYYGIPAGHIKRILGIHCPVDAVVYDESGKPVAGVINNQAEYYDSEFGDVLIIIDEDEKWICLPNDKDYDVRLSATDSGEMKYEVFDVDLAKDNIISSVKAFENVALASGKEMHSEVDAEDDVSETTLYVLNQNEGIVAEISEDGSEQAAAVLVSDIILQDDTIELKVGDAVQLSAEIRPKYATNKAIKWTSSNRKVVTVDDQGRITAVGAGQAVIEASSVDGGSTASVQIISTPAEKNIADCTITLSNSSYTYNGSARKPTVTVKDGESVLTSDTDYTVTYANNKNAGTATVTVTGKGSYIGTANKSFKINKAAVNLAFADVSISKKTTDAAFTNTLTKTTDGTVTFSSSDTKVAEVNSTSGQVTIKGAGTVTITASAAEGTNYKAGSSSYTLTVEASAPTPAAAGFSDVQDSSHPYYKAIYWAAGKGITKGYSDGTFGINRSCTRGEMMMFLWKYAKKPAPKTASKSPFKDVSSSHAFYKAILWGYQNGITKGYSDGSFGINRNVSRGEAMMFLWKLKNKPAPQMTSKSPFTDVPTSHAFYKAILWGSQKGITKGYTSGANKGKFGINDNCTRGQIVTFLYRAQ